MITHISKIAHLENLYQYIILSVTLVRYILLHKTKENLQKSMNHEADKNMHFDHSG